MQDTEEQSGSILAGMVRNLLINSDQFCPLKLNVILAPVKPFLERRKLTQQTMPEKKLY